MVFVLTLAAGVLPAQAQTRPAPSDSIALPDIPYREVEILGEVEVSFPQMQRQPLTGFNPPPMIYQVPRDRRPFVGDYKQQVRDLPGSELNAPQPPGVSFLIDGEPARGDFKVGLGTYLSRDVAGRVRHQLGDRSGVYASGTYFGMSNFTPFPNDAPDLEAPLETFTGRAGLTTGQDGFNAGVELDGMASSHRLYGSALEYDDGNPDRSGAGLGLSGWIKNSAGAATRFELEGRYGGSGFELESPTGTEDPLLHRDEKRLDGHALLGRRFGGNDVTLSGNVAAGALDAETPFGSDYLSYDAGGTIRLLLGDQADLRAGLRMLGYESSARNLGRNPAAASVGSAYMAPSVELNFYPSPGLRAYARSVPGLETHGLADVMRINPYVVSEPYLQPTISTVDAEAGGVYFSGPVRVGLSAGYQRSPSYLYFVPNANNLFRPAYDLAEIVRVGADLAISLPNRVSTAFMVTWRDGKLSDQDELPIPYFASFLAEVQVSYRFDGRRGLVQATGGYEGPYDNLPDVPGGTTDQPDELGGFLDLDVEGSYFFQDHIGFYVRIDNLGAGGYARWDAYPEPTWVTRGGLRLRW